MRGKSPLFLCLLIFLAATCRQEKDYNPNSHLTVPEQEEVMEKAIRYMARPPDGISFEERFYKGYDEHYAEQRRLHRLDAYFVDKGTHYFLVSRVAPSLREMRVAIGGKLKLAGKGDLSSYEEVFRTWKMEPDTLIKRSVFLFDMMVRGEDLEPYYSSKSGNTNYIEFPDDRVYFDTSKRIWKTRSR